MARLRCEPADENVDRTPSRGTSRRVNTDATEASADRPTRTKEKICRNWPRLPDDDDDSEDEASSFRLIPKTPSGQQKKQIRLAPPSTVQSSRKPVIKDNIFESNLRPSNLPGSNSLKRKQSPVKRKINEQRPPSPVEPASDGLSDHEGPISIWSESSSFSDESEEELPSPRRLLTSPRKSDNQSRPGKTSKLHSNLLEGVRALSIFDDITEPSNEAMSMGQPYIRGYSCPAENLSDKENIETTTRKSPPPRLRTPPPCSPSKSRLQSPAKKPGRVPTPPHRQSLDLFWNSERVNEWNDQYSPQKPLKSPKKLKSVQDTNSASPTTSPRKTQSPSKRSRAEIEARNAFNARKQRIASDFFTELDTVVTGSKIHELVSSTGGVQFLWSKTLNSTAGRANWRRETTKTQQPDGSIQTTFKHYASIELAEKVIDDENRLLNVIAHEFCHLANFMVSEVKDQPHGRQFKEWGRKCTEAFGTRGVEVTTKHSYQIEYKYIWQCSSDNCGLEFKRHSKSIDPTRHTCGSCRSGLVQIRPVPRRNNSKVVASTNTTTAGNGMQLLFGGEGDRNTAVRPAPAINGYAAYMKSHFATIRRDMPQGTSHKELMTALSAKYRREKEQKSLAARSSPDVASGPTDVLPGDTTQSKTGELETVDTNSVTRTLEVVTLSDTES